MAMPTESTHVLVYIDEINAEAGKFERGATPIGYIERRAFEPILKTAEIARECFDISENVTLSLRAIEPDEMQKILDQEGMALKLNERDFASIFVNSGAEPGRWIELKEHTKAQKIEENVSKPVQKSLFG